MKKIIAMILAATMICSLAACGAKSTGNEASETESTPEDVESIPETELEESAESEEPQRNTATVITSDDLEVADTGTEVIRGGTNQDDAILLPMNTKLYGTVTNNSWFAFTTGPNAETTYHITSVNKSLGTGDLYLYLYNEYGEQLGKITAGSNGIAGTGSYNQLSPNTTYYICADPALVDRTIDYMLIIRDSNEQSDAYKTAGNLTEARGTADALEGEIYPGTNQDDAVFLPLGIKVAGTANSKAAAWFAFTTSDSADAVYTLTLINKSSGTGDLHLYLYNEYGEQVSRITAESNGVASTKNFDQLSPNTVYYMRVVPSLVDTTSEFSLNLQALKETDAASATIEELEEEQLVFETPFELNSTQVMFVANKAVFIDENAAKAALEPVAEVILAHPDHSILIAGTTATDGTQESCVDLSNRRAAAVKDLLVSAFGVPESQIQTIGLGYEADPFVRGKDRDANGNFVETEGAKNRRVVVLDIDDPIAQELLNN